MELELKRKKLLNRLMSLKDIDGVNIRVSGPEKSRVAVKRSGVHSLDFQFVWSKDHYIGYFVDHEGQTSQAVISLWEPMDAVNFATAYSLLVNMRARQKA